MSQSASDSESQSATHSESEYECESESESESMKLVDEQATKYFTVWTSKRFLSVLRDHKQNLTDISNNFLNLCYNGIQVGARSVYLSNEKMKDTLRGYDKWGQYIFPGNVGLHKKFKANAGVLAHIIKQIDLYEGDEEKMDELNDKIKENSETYTTLKEMLDSGLLTLFLFVFHTQVT